jgi:hypothetical protein
VSTAFALYVGVTLPARRVSLPGAIPPSVVYGGYHVHSTRSDGTGAPDDIAAAAARAGLRFVILTDHGNATRAPDPPAYRHGVLVIDAVEISTSGGHVIALHLERAAPYPLAGEPRDVVEDIHRLGGWAFVAHPDSPKPELRWTAWNVPFDGLEWLNADSEWRDETAGHLAMTVVRSLVRGPESVASLFARPDRTIARWDGATRRRSVVAVGALDAHAHLPWSEDAPRHASALALPSYAEMFGTIAQAVPLDRPLAGDAAADAERLLAAIHRGRTFTIIRAIAGPATLVFTAAQGETTAGMGDRLETPGVETTFRAAVPGVAAAHVALMQDGREVRSGPGSVAYAGVPPPGAYRVEVTYPGVAMPWIVSNPIYIGPEAAIGAADVPAPALLASGRSLAASPDWAIEHQPASTGAFTVEGEDLRFTYSLDTAAASPFAALVSPVSGDEGVRHIEFVGRADRPMRISVQVRLLGARDGRRWVRSVYLDETPRHVTMEVADFQPTGPPTVLRPTVATVRSLLFVVDTLNTPPGARGTVWLSRIALGGG